jgi:hypothetical protein
VVAPNRARNSHELSAPPRPPYIAHDTARNARSISLESTRLIYFDRNRAGELLEHIASSTGGRAALAKIPGSGPTDLILQRNQRSILSRLISDADDLAAEGLIDLHQPDGVSRRVRWSDVHPDQAIAVRGTVASVKDIQPSSMRLKAETITVRAFVNKDHFLHLNQSYLTAWPITILGSVRSVPRLEVLAVAIGIIQKANSPG